MLLKHNFLLFSIFFNQKHNGGPGLGTFLYIYKTGLASSEIFSPPNKIHRAVGRAKDLSAPRYNSFPLSASLFNLTFFI
jgi:hypothetical protein